MKNLFVGISKKRIIIDFMFSIMVSLLNCVFTYIMSMTLDNFMKDTFMSFILVVMVVEVSFTVSDFLQAYHISTTSCAIENGVYQYYMNKLYGIKPSVLRRNNTGYMAGVLNKVVVRQSDAYAYVVCGMPIDIAYVCYFAFVLGKFDLRIGLSVVLVSVLGAAIRVCVKHVIWPIGLRIAEYEGDRTKLFTDVVSNMEIVQKMSVIDFMNDRAEATNDKCLREWNKWAILDELANAVGKLITFGFGPVCLLIMYNMDKACLSNNLSLVAMIVVVSTQLPHNAKSFARTVSRCSKFRDTAIKLEEIVYKENVRKDECSDTFQSVQISNVSHRYRDEEHDINIEVQIPYFRVNRGEKVCITGESGQGKTTLLNILSGCIESNNVLINGDTNAGRLSCVFIAQDVEIFDMSLRDNLCLGNPNITEYEMEYLINAVGLGDWFAAIGRDWDTPLGERGVFVSTGQRQRLNLCRGLLSRNADVYLLDEPTSNVDDETEKRIVSLLKEYLHDKTVVIVTHRPLIRTICDYEYKFSNGVLGDKVKVE